VAKAPAKPATKTPAKPAAKPATKPAANKPAAKAPVKPAAKPVAQAPATKLTAKEVAAAAKASAAPVVEQSSVVIPEALTKPAKVGRKAPAAPAVLEDESPWTKAELNAVRKQLDKDVAERRAEVSELENSLRSLIQDSSDGAGDDQADAGTKTFEREHEMSVLYNAQMLLDQAERAIQRLGLGTYGSCEMCSQPIGKHRLQYMPRATLCRSCREREDRR
jgi:hypothetical protein